MLSFLALRASTGRTALSFAKTFLFSLLFDIFIHIKNLQKHPELFHIKFSFGYGTLSMLVKMVFQAKSNFTLFSPLSLSGG